MKLSYLAIAALMLVSPTAATAAKYRVLHNFGRGTDSKEPFGALAWDVRGNLYGVTGAGGPDKPCTPYGCGTAFKLAPRSDGSWQESVLHDFRGDRDGAYPYGTMVFDSYGNLYGTLVGGPSSGAGVFKLSSGTKGWSNARIYTDGAGPGLMIDSLGNLYGEMGPGEQKGGAIGELSKGAGGWNYTALFSFDGTDGLTPEAPPIWDTKGDMLGTTLAGGIYGAPCWTYSGCGVVFKMTPDGNGTWTYRVLHTFASSKDDGQSPSGGLVMDKLGNVYGTTDLGGRYDNGTVFKLAETGGHWEMTQIYDFPNCKYGCLPSGNLIFDTAGNLYGVASGGLPDCGYTCGVVFKLTPQENGKWKYSVLHKFSGPDGALPGYGLAIDNQGNLFGVTSSGGKYNFGVAFEISTTPSPQ
ncbi:MAG TPA: choice-of-anchor tandem repeat GloVer-containing protein [Terriglobales bacterium]